MSAYTPKTTKTSDGTIIFNKNNIVSPTETVSNDTLTTKLDQYLPLNGGVISGSVSFQNNAMLVFDGESQSSAFTDALYDKIIIHGDKLENIDFSNGITTITGTTNISNLVIPDSNLPMSKINHLNSTINTINGNITTNANNITTNINNINTNTNSINTINTTLTTKTNNEEFDAFKSVAQDKLKNISQSNNITTIVNDVSIENLLIPDNNLTISKINNLQPSLNTISSNILAHSNDITTINMVLEGKTNNLDFANFQNEVNETLTDVSYNNLATTINNTLNCDEVIVNNLTINNSLELDGSFIISNENYTITDIQFSYLKDIDENIKSKITTIDNVITQNNNDITSTNATLTTQGILISTLQSDNETNKNNISELQSDNTINKNNITTLQTNNGTDQSNISSLQSRMTTAENNIAVKQNQLNNTTRLNCAYIADGSVNNNQFQTLNGIDTTKTIQYQLDGITNSISTLTGLQDIDFTKLQNVGDDITELQTFKTSQISYNGTNDSSINSLNTFKTAQLAINNNLSNSLLEKQNTINSGNRLSSDYIATNLNNHVSNLSSYLIEIEENFVDIFTGKQDTLNATTNKLPISYVDLSSSPLSYVDINSSLNTKLLGKQDIIDINNKIPGNYVNVSYSNSLEYGSIPDGNVNNEFINVRDAINLSHSQLITAIETKQNLISSDSKIPSAYVSGSYRNGFASLDQIIFDMDTYLVEGLNSKQDIIDQNNKLSSSNISTNINSTNGVLNNVLQSITDINTTQSSNIATITDNITNLNNGSTTTINSINTINTNITNLQSQDITHTNAINELNDHIDTLDGNINLKQNIISNSNKVSSDYIATNVNNHVSNLSTVLIDIEDNFADIFNGKQDKLNSTDNKLPISNIDLGTSSLSYIDINSSLNTQLTNIKNDISTLNGLQAGDITSFQNINSELTLINQDLNDLDTAILTKQNIIDSSNRLNANLIGTGEVSNAKLNFLKNVSSDIQTQINNINAGGGGGSGGSSIPSITYDANNLITNIDNTTQITTLEFSGDNTLQTTAFTNSLKSDVNNNTTKLTDITYSTNKTTIANNLECNNITGTTISNINSSINGKQDILNASSNTLNPSYINGGSSLTSQKITWLSSIAQDLQTKLDALQSSIDALITADTSQTTTNTNLTNSINTLTTDKQDLLSNTNKLNSSYINAGSGTISNLKMQYLSSIGGDITDALNSKQNTITDGSLTIARTAGLQSAINGKLNNTGGTMTGDLNFSNSASITGAQVIRCNFIQSSSGTNCFACDNTTGMMFNTLTDTPSVGNFSILAGDLANKFLFYSSSSARNAYLPHPTSFNSNGAFVGINMANTGASSWTFGMRIEGSSTNIYSASIAVGANVGAIFVCNGTNWRIFGRY